MKNRKLLLIVSLVLALTMSLGGTLAYLTDTDADVNTMVLGNVKIVQNEQKRTEGGLDEFVSGLPALPAVTTSDEDWAPIEPVEMDNGMWVNMWGDNVKNDIDKIVTVTNTGKSPAYVRTIVAIEDTEELDANIHISDMMAGYYATEADAKSKTNRVQTMVGNAWEKIGLVKIDDTYFSVLVATYKDPLPAGKTSAPSLTGVALDDAVTGEMIEALGDEWEIRVLSQAVQADGFGSAVAALNAGFPMGNDEETKKNTIAGWMTKAKLEADIASPSDEYPDNNPPEKKLPTTSWQDNAGTMPAEVDGVYTISTAAELAAFAKEVNVNNINFAGKTVKLATDIDLGANLWIPVGQTGATEFKGVFDGQNHTISNLYVDSSAQKDEHYSSGLFGWIESQGQDITIKNVTVDGANIAGHHNVAVIAGYLEGDSVVENCHVKNATLTNTHANGDACGDKAGVIAGYAASEVTIKNCSANNCTISAGRDAGQLLGASHTTPVDCSATNVTVSATGDCNGTNIRNELVGREL